jgi:hypothetical protein
MHPVVWDGDPGTDGKIEDWYSGVDLVVFLRFTHGSIDMDSQD